MASKQQVNDFINKIAPDVITVCKERGYGDIQAWTCICQAGLESAWGTSSTMKNAHAYFGVKATTGWVKAAKYGGLVYSARTKECYDGFSLISIKDTFRAYSRDIDSIRDYFDLMENKRYKACLSPDLKTVKDCITIIKNGGYATAPNYIDSICKTFLAHQDEIVKYHVGTTVVSVKNEDVYPVLKRGSTNSKYVKILQQKLNDKINVRLSIDGIMGDKTYLAVLQFQGLKCIKKDGIVGAETWKYLLM